MDCLVAMEMKERVFYLSDRWVNEYTDSLLGETALQGIRITSLERDSDDRCWVGTLEKGIYCLDKSFKQSGHVLRNGIRHVNDLELDLSNNRLFVATDEGIVVFTRGKYWFPDKKNGQLAKQVTHLQLSKNILLSATDNGVNVFDLHSLEHVDEYANMLNEYVYCTEIMNGHIFIGTLHGLKIISRRKLAASFDKSNSPLENEWVTALTGLNGDLYIGTYGGGVYVLDRDNQWTSFQTKGYSCEINFNAVCVDERYVYMGTFAHGLLIIDTLTWSVSRICEGLLSRNVTAIQCDDTYLYIGTENGINRVPKHLVL